MSKQSLYPHVPKGSKPQSQRSQRQRYDEAIAVAEKALKEAAKAHNEANDRFGKIYDDAMAPARKAWDKANSDYKKAIAAARGIRVQ